MIKWDSLKSNTFQCQGGREGDEEKVGVEWGEMYFLFKCNELDGKEAPIVDIVHAFGGWGWYADKVC